MRSALGLPTAQPSSTSAQPSTSPMAIESQPAAAAAPAPLAEPAPQLPNKTPPVPTRNTSRASQRNTPPSPGFAYLSGDKIPIGDYLALLVGNNEFL